MKINNINQQFLMLSKINYNSTPNEKKFHNSLLSSAEHINFGMRVSYGVPASLSKDLQLKIENMHSNMDVIKNFFAKYNAKNPQLSSLIKKEYSGLVPKRQSGIVFKLPDTENTIEIMRSQTRQDVLYISIDDKSVNYNGIIIKGKDKLIANYLKLHPHMLPRELKYMDEEAIQKAQPKKFIDIANELLQNYSDYIRKLESGELPFPKLVQSSSKKAKPIKNNKDVISSDNKKEEKLPRKDIKLEEKKEINPARLSDEELNEYITKKNKTIINDITKIFNSEPQDIPKHLSPIRTKSGSMLGFTLQTEDGGSLKVTKKVIGAYGDDMPYLAFEITKPNKAISYINIDIITNKVLRTTDKGKPHISSSHVVYELSPAEIKKRKIFEKLDYYMSQIKGEPVSSFKKEKTAKKSNAKTKINVQTDILEKWFFNLEGLNSINEQELGKNNGTAAAAEYINAFKAQFLSELQTKMSEFNTKVQKLIEFLSE